MRQSNESTSPERTRLPRTPLLTSLGRLALAVSLLSGLLLVPGAGPAAADGGVVNALVFPVGPPVAPEGLRVQWEAPDNPFYVRIFREEPAADWTRYAGRGHFDDSGLERDHEYRYNVCAYYFDGGICSGWKANRVPSATPSSPSQPPPSPKPAPEQPAPPKPSPKPLAQPVLRATPAGTGFPNYLAVNLRWENPPDAEQRALLTDQDWYRDGKIFYKGWDLERQDSVRSNSGPYRYQLCIKNAVDEQCSEEVSAAPTPVAPTAPTNVQLTPQWFPGGKIGNGGIVLPPRHKVSVTWFNTDIVGTFVTVERQDTRMARNSDPSSPIGSVPELFWNELSRLSGPANPTAAMPSSELVDAGPGVTAPLQVGKTYRVCAVVPKLGEAGKVCSAPATLP